MNKVIMDGNLTKNPELRFTTNGKAVATFAIAVNEGYGDKKQTNYFNIVAWGKIGENVANYLDKGSKVLICGVQGRGGTIGFPGLCLSKSILLEEP